MCRGALLLLALAQLLAARLSPTAGIEIAVLDGLSIVSYQPLEGRVGAETNVDAGGDALRFSPPKLVLGNRPLGVPHVERVDVLNRSNRTVRLSSITGNTQHFHSSFFTAKAVPPNGNASFDVVFLGRTEGSVDADLFIRTSEGVRKYTMSATSVPCAYRLPPLLRLSLPQNATYSPLIYMHNPHDYPVQITEVYSSGGNVLLELPGGGLEGPQTLWLLPPHATRPVIAVRYDPPPLSLHRPPLRDKESSQTIVSFVRIKFHGVPSMLSSVLVVAVEILAFSEPGPYAVPQSFDFGYGGTRDPPKKVRIYMGNSSPRPVRISSIDIQTENGIPWGGLRVLSSSKMLIPPFTPPNVNVATLSVNWKQVYDSGQCCGKVIIKTKPDHRIELPFTSHALNGGLIMNDESVTKYLTSESGISAVRQVLLKNVFKVPVYVTDLIIGKDVEKHFQISGFYPHDFKVNTIQHGFRIQLKSWTKSLKFESKITLVTNISTQVIPVYIYNGKLDLLMSIPPRPSKKGTLDLGLVSVSSTSRAALFLHNTNPVPVCLRGSGSDLSGVALQLLGCSAQIPASFDVDATFASNVTACTCIPAKWCAVYVVSVVAPATPALVNGELWIATVHERLVVPVALTAAIGGRLSQPEPTKFGDCFPGTLCTLPLKIKSSFPVDMDVVSVEAVPSDKRVFYVKKNNFNTPDVSSSTIVASKLNDIGWLHYDPYLYCEGKCYTGLDLNSSVGLQWLSLISLPANTLESDAALVKTRYFLYTNLTLANPLTNISVRVDTTQVRNHILPTHVSFVWPRLYAGPGTITTPVSQVGKPTEFFIHIVNPSQTRSVLVQLVFDWMLGDVDKIQTLPNRLHPPGCEDDEWWPSNRAFFFSRTNRSVLNNDNYQQCQDKIDCDEYSDHDVNWLPKHLRPHPDSYLFDLPPGGEKNVSITFLTMFPKKISSILIIRNNLTIIEMLRLTGQGVVASLKFGNRKPGSNTPLLFEMTEKHLKDCDRDKAKKLPVQPNFTVKRTLVARNTGVIPVKITRFFINGIECEGYGFRVLNCEAFELAPNGTHKVDIAFTPDFTLTKVQRLLILETSLTDAVNFTLIASVPVSWTGKCASILRRPTWESSLLGITVSILVCIGMCVVLAACYESYKILTAMKASLVRDPSTIQPPFDLKVIGQMGLNKKSDMCEFCPSLIEYKVKNKLHNWNCDNYQPSEDCKLTTHSTNQKYEDSYVTNANVKHKKKTTKKNFNLSDTNQEQSADQDGQQNKEKCPKSNKNNSWKIISRDSILNIKGSTKCASECNSLDSSEMQKVVEPVSEQTNEKIKNNVCDNSKKTSNSANEDSDNSKFNNSQQPTFSNNNKKHSKSKCSSTSSHSCEEDTSSVSAESSNNDDMDKDNDNSKSSSSKSGNGDNNISKKSPDVNKKGKFSNQCKYNDEGDGEDDEYDHKSQSSQSSSQNDNQRWSKNKESSNTSSQKNGSDNDKQSSDKANKASNVNLYECINPTSGKHAKKDSQNNKQKREKQPLSKKRSLDKSFVYGSKSENNQTNTFNVARSSPTTPPVATVWENRASFSDVVSRSDNAVTSNNFVARPKESQDIKKIEQKPTPHPIINTNYSNQCHNQKLKMEEPRKSDNNQSSDLGPIGSNYYSKKMAQTGNHSLRYSIPNEKTNRMPIVDLNVSNTQDYVFNPAPYFTGNYSDIQTPGSNYNMSSHNINNAMRNSYSSIGCVNDMNRLQYASNGSVVQNMNPNVCDMTSNSMRLRDMNHYDNRSQAQNLQDYVTGSSLWEIAKGNISLLNDNGSENPWSQMNGDGIPYVSNMHNTVDNTMNPKLFKSGYGQRNIYEDNKTGCDLGNLWNSNLTVSPPNSTQNTVSSNGHHQTTSSGISSSDCGAAEWLWGYNNSASTSSAPKESPETRIDTTTTTQAPSSHFFNQTHYQHRPSAQQEMNTFDPYNSLSSIWSTGPSKDLWSNPNSHERNNQDLNNHGNNYQ